MPLKVASFKEEYELELSENSTHENRVLLSERGEVRRD
jgi:hypothetical protein